jgi:serine/threonine protein kinase
VLLTPEGVAKIKDFGLAQARFLAGEAPSAARAGASLVVPGVGLMTPAYAAPEQAAGQPLTRRSDLWSWAVSVLELFVGALTWRSGVVAAEVLEPSCRVMNRRKEAATRNHGFRASHQMIHAHWL